MSKMGAPSAASSSSSMQSRYFASTSLIAAVFAAVWGSQIASFERFRPHLAQGWFFAFIIESLLYSLVEMI